MILTAENEDHGIWSLASADLQPGAEKPTPLRGSGLKSLLIDVTAAVPS